MTFPTVEALHTIPSYASETAAWPLQNLRTLRTLAAASTGLSTAAWPLVEAFDEAWLQLLIGLSFQLAFPAVEAMHAIPSYLRFRDCSVLFGPLAAASTAWAFQLLGHWSRLSTRLGCSCHSSWPFQLWRPCTQFLLTLPRLQNLRIFRIPRRSPLPLLFQPLTTAA